MLYPQSISDSILDSLKTFCVDGFDCAIHTLGVCTVDVDPYALMLLPSGRSNPTWPTADRLDYLLWLLRLYNRAADSFIRIVNIDVWDLAPGGGTLAGKVDTAARTLKTKLTAAQQLYGTPDRMLYEFQMNINDKSRTVSTFLRYHYSDICPVSSIGGAHKNTLTLAPHLDHRLYLQRYSNAYRANKEHCADSLLWWAKTFNVDISHIPSAIRKDAGDAFMQILAALQGGSCSLREQPPPFTPDSQSAETSGDSSDVRKEKKAKLARGKTATRGRGRGKGKKITPVT